jgi:hypothetical protein
MMKDEDKSLQSNTDPGFTLTFLSALVIMLAVSLIIIYLAGA